MYDLHGWEDTVGGGQICRLCMTSPQESSDIPTAWPGTLSIRATDSGPTKELTIDNRLTNYATFSP